VRGGRVRWRSRGFRSGPQSDSRGHARPPAEQLSPDKSMNFPYTTAALTLSRAPDGLRHVVLTRPGTPLSMRLLFVRAHVCARASFGHPLAGLPWPPASSYIRPHRGLHRYSYRGLPPHQFMPMPGVHKALESVVLLPRTASSLCGPSAAQRCL